MTRLSSGPDVFPACERARHLFRLATHTVPKAVSAKWRIARSWNAASRSTTAPILFVFEARSINDAWLRLLHRVGHRRQTAFLMLAGSIPCQGISERLAKLNVRDPERIHVANVSAGQAEEGFVERLLLTLGGGDQQERILDAWWEDDTFVVINPLFQRLHIPVAKIRCFANKPKTSLGRFEIDEDGLFVYWPDLDVHLGWEQFAQLVDNSEYMKARQESDIYNRQYGQAIREFRESMGLKQSEIAGLTPRQVGRIERGECRATHSALTKLAVSHHLPMSDFLARLAELFGGASR